MLLLLGYKCLLYFHGPKVSSQYLPEYAYVCVQAYISVFQRGGLSNFLYILIPLRLTFHYPRLEVFLVKLEANKLLAALRLGYRHALASWPVP